MNLLPKLISQLDQDPGIEFESTCIHNDNTLVHDNETILDRYGTEVVQTIILLGVYRGLEKERTILKHLNFNVLLVSQSTSSRSKLLGLEVIYRLIKKIKMEYLVFLPELLTFISELINEPVSKLRNKCQD